MTFEYMCVIYDAFGVMLYVVVHFVVDVAVVVYGVFLIL